jgi:beta-ribofuranosylaminobenzene 5'-phosphate synthase
MTVQVTTGARLHFGFQNLSLAHDRLYGGVGVALGEPRAVVAAEPATSVTCDHEPGRRYTAEAVDVLDVPGATVRVRESLPRHLGLGSGTQLALAIGVAVARAHEIEVDVDALAPKLGRGGRSGVGVATFENGGFVADAGQPTSRFTSDPPAEGNWEVPPVVARHDVPENWRFVLVVPDAEPGRSGTEEDQSMRSIVERADAEIASEIAEVLSWQLYPAIASGDVDQFGAGVGRLGRLNGAWYADEQGGVYRPPAGALVEALSDCHAVTGAGQSSWGPTVYGITDAARQDDAVAAARAALDSVDEDGEVSVARPRNHGARIDGD